MNTVPTEFVRLEAERLIDFTRGAFLQVGTSEDNASLIADLLVQTNLRGVFSRGPGNSTVVPR